jgi:tetraacyldisaccharide 4'-kinase
MIFKKPKFWDKNKDLNFFAYLLLPFTIPIRLSNIFSNFFNKYKAEKIITICIGNIYLGGTGKTPTVIKLFEILKKLNFRVVVGKKFYKSHLDEIALLKKKTKLLLGESRLQIIKKAIKSRNKLVIFDDGLQDKKIDYNLKIACFDAINSIGNGFIIPSGPLRESLNSLKRFDAVFIKNIEGKNYDLISIIKKINPKIKIFNSEYIIKNLKKFNLSKNYMIFSGIGNPKSFEKLLKKNKFNIVNEINFTDHYNYKNDDILKIIEKSKKLKAKIITTEKDYVKIPKIYQKKMDYISIDLKIEKIKNLINFLKNKNK